MYGSYAKHPLLSHFDDGETATALDYNNAIGDEESTWIMWEPFTVTRFSVMIITAMTLTTAAVVSLFRKAKAGSGVGADDASSSAAFMTDTGEAFTVNEFVGWTIYNITDGSSGIITANTATTVTATLSGGTDNDWDSGDKYVIGYKLADVTIPIGTADPKIGDIIYADVENAVNVSGSGPTASDAYKRRGTADINAGEQLAVFSTTLGAGSAGTFQPVVLGHHRAEVAANQTKMSVST